MTKLFTPHLLNVVCKTRRVWLSNCGPNIAQPKLPIADQCHFPCTEETSSRKLSPLLMDVTSPLIGSSLSHVHPLVCGLLSPWNVAHVNKRAWVIVPRCTRNESNGGIEPVRMDGSGNVHWHLSCSWVPKREPITNPLRLVTRLLKWKTGLCSVFTLKRTRYSSAIYGRREVSPNSVFSVD